QVTLGRFRHQGSTDLPLRVAPRSVDGARRVTLSTCARICTEIDVDSIRRTSTSHMAPTAHLRGASRSTPSSRMASRWRLWRVPSVMSSRSSQFVMAKPRGVSRTAGAFNVLRDAGPSHRRFGGESAAAAGPAFDVGPGPHESLLQCDGGLGEVGVPAAPVVHDLGPREAEALRDLCGADELVRVELSTHRRDGRSYRCPCSGCVADTTCASTARCAYAICRATA
ncbi:MAG: hypothetical protein V7636_220, partial [Actinomycetota bacterium]